MASSDMRHIMVVDDDRSLREALVDILESEGYRVTACDGVASALIKLQDDRFGYDLVLSDIQMTPSDGLSLLASIGKMQLGIPVILMTAYGSVNQAVSAIRAGARDYLVKPFDADELVSKLEGCLSKVTASGDYVFGDSRMQEVVAMARRIANSDATVMIAGESGSGKEVMARFIHENSPRAEKPFIAINCAAIPESMLEAMLFGYEKGAFTGALKSTPGKFEQAQGGTLLLDEISEMDLALQAKLLRVIQEREVERLGSRDTISLDVRVLATTNRNLREEVSANRFREDLYYRLNVLPVTLPALRERPGDIEPIANLLLKKHTPRGAVAKHFGRDALSRMLAHQWPGNVRELENVVQRAIILAEDSEIQAADLHIELQSLAGQTAVVEKVDDEGLLEQDLKSREAQMIVEVLKQCNGSRKDTAERLGISPRTLRYKLARMREMGIRLPNTGSLATA